MKRYKDLPTRTYKVAGGRIVGHVDGIDALRQHIDKVLTTHRHDDLVYKGYFGIDVYDLIGQPKSFIQGKIKKRVAEAILIDERFKDITDFEVREIGEDFISIYFNVVTADDIIISIERRITFA